ncbi:hypothetical protein EZS27_001352 [termite gut metagenome]|uniref:Uncharacterized protein n=1 Tax=termite gut metagenome TaxID=433724 RepID=A0A5J4SY73_9ZZZZ
MYYVLLSYDKGNNNKKNSIMKTTATRLYNRLDPSYRWADIKTIRKYTVKKVRRFIKKETEKEVNAI